MIKRLQEAMMTPQMIVSDAFMIQYLINEHYEVGERMIALLIRKNDEPILFLNKLFKKPNTIKCIQFDDTEDSIKLLMQHIQENQALALDGTFQFRFTLPFIQENYTLENASPTLESLRRIKTPKEMELLFEASQENDRVMDRVRQEIKLGVSEIELAEKVKEFHNKNTSFEPIVVFTENIADPHGIPTNRTLTENDVVLVDMGGMVNNYASDMTRAFFVGDHPELEAIYKIVLEANKAAIEAVKIGAPLSSVDKAARDVITKHGYGEAFIHRTGHGIGIECHENLDVSSTNDTSIEVGMCFSIEPGIYIEGLGGIRIEDLVCVHEDGVHVLNSYDKEFNQIQVIL